MKFRISIACQTEEGEETPSELMVLARDDLAMETLGLTLAESKALLHELQSYVAERQAAAYLEQQRISAKCGRRYASKGQGRRTVNTVFGPTTVGIDGGMIRTRHKAGFFEVIAGKSVVAFRRDEEDDIPSAKRFGFVQTYDAKPRRRLWELMKSQGMQENQAVLFMSDGADTVRNLQAYLHPSSEHILDWFHVTMRLTVMQQQTKALIE